jgi:hypothetical protein
MSNVRARCRFGTTMSRLAAWLALRSARGNNSFRVMRKGWELMNSLHCNKTPRLTRKSLKKKRNLNCYPRGRRSRAPLDEFHRLFRGQSLVVLDRSPDAGLQSSFPCRSPQRGASRPHGEPGPCVHQARHFSDYGKRAECVVSTGDKGSHSSRCGPEPVIHPREPGRRGRSKYSKTVSKLACRRNHASRITRARRPATPYREPPSGTW